MKTTYTAEDVFGNEAFKVGDSPAGVEWVLYRSGLGDAEFAADATRLRARLDDLRAKHRETTRVRVNLTGAQVAAIEEVWGIDLEAHDGEGGTEDLRGVELRRTFVEGMSSQLETIAQAVDDFTMDEENLATSVELDDGASDLQRYQRMRFSINARRECFERCASALRQATGI